MKLIYDLPTSAKKVVYKEILNESILICLPFDVDFDGNYVDGWFVATENHLIVFNKRITNKIKLSKKEWFSVEVSFGSAFLEIRNKNKGSILLNFSMQYVEHFRLATIILNGKKDKNFYDNMEKTNSENFSGFPSKDGNTYRKNSSKKIFFRKIKFLLSKHFKTLILLTLLALTLTAVATIKPYVFAMLIDDYLIPLNKDIKGILTIGFFLIIMDVFRILIETVNTLVIQKMSKNISSELRNRIYKKIMKVGLKYLDSKSIGDVLERLNNTNDIKDFIVNDVKEIFNQTITFLIALIVVLSLSWQIAVVIFICSPFVLFISYKTQNIYNEIAHKKFRLNDSCVSFILDTLKGIKTVKIFNKEEKVIKDYEEKNNKLNETVLKNEKIYNTLGQLMTILSSIGRFLIILFTGIWVIQNRMTLGQMTQTMQYYDLLYGPVLWLANFPSRLAGVIASTERVFDILDQEDKVISNEGKKIDIVGNIKLEHVYFGYDPIRPVLKDICLYVKAGETIGLVGVSGMGKSTLTNLIMRLYNVDSGCIKIDGVNINDIDDECFRNALGVVLQDSFLLSGTIRENISYSRPDAPLEDVIKAAKASYAHDFIMNLPDGYDTFIGDLGSNLSGGEKQRICIARALFGNPKILILDEATASVDLGTERKIQNALKELLKNRTTFIIAHRLSTIKNADRIVVINNNVIAEVGTHEELMKKKGTYYDLMMTQMELVKF